MGLIKLTETTTVVAPIGYIDGTGNKWNVVVEERRILLWKQKKTFAIRFDGSGNVIERKRLL